MKTPTTILTGFLGSGKSTLLTEILTDPNFSNSAVIVNEFGEVGLDDFLVAHSNEQVMEMTTGCLCCTIRGDISNTLFDLWTKRKNGALPNFERIIIETTGLADPAPVIQTFMNDPLIFSRFFLSGVVTTVDILNNLNTLEQHEECLKQIAVADRIVITKTDLEKGKALLSRVQERLEQINPSAEILEKTSPDFDLKDLFNTDLYKTEGKNPNVQKWLNIEKIHHHHHHEHHHHHDINKHGDDIETYSILIDAPVQSQDFIGAIQSLINSKGRDLLRIKGILNLTHRPDKPSIVHGVQHVFHEPYELEGWPSEDRRTKLVFITRNISRDTIEKHFKEWL